MRRFVLLSVFASACAAPAASGADGGPGEEQVRFFETRVRPVLADHCYECHGPETQESDLRLDSLAAILEGGKAGPAVVPGKPEQSLLVTAIGYRDDTLKMPPETKLSDQQIADLTEWIRIGVPYPGQTAAMVQGPSLDLEEARRFWAFQPPADPPPPAVGDATWPQSPLDHFILAKLEEAGLRPAPPADKRTLIRRATFDLTGLPPTPQEVEAFLADESPDAFSRVIDRLLASPAYGERWGRHWLDVARYADSNGLDENVAHGNAWRYRDYVIRALNADKPYDEFLAEQLAGDLLATDDPLLRNERLTATGFLALGPKVLAEADKRKLEMDIVDEQIDTLGRALLGLTLGCARCHDHKFDPLLNSDYYALAGILKSTRTMESLTTIARWHENPVPLAADLARKAEHDQQLAGHKQRIEQYTAEATARLQAQLGAGAALPENPETQYPPETQAELQKLRDELAALEKAAPVMPAAMGVSEGTVADVAIHVRGSHLTLGEVVPRRFPLVLAGDGQPPLGPSQSGRLELARWLTRPDHPLTARVMVNRLWRWHFGQGLVATTDNFGHLGERPSHPELLDWLARRFVESGWSVKALHRTVLLSATYRQAASADCGMRNSDCGLEGFDSAIRNPNSAMEDRLRSRADVRRLEAEALRDALLAVSGRLDRAMGGSLLTTANRTHIFDHTSKDQTTYDSTRRSVYLPVVRNHLYDVFQLFDYGDESTVTGDRATSTVAPQALFLLNGELVIAVSEALAGDLLARADLDDRGRVAELYLRTLSRPAGDDEVTRALAYVEKLERALAMAQTDNGQRHKLAWASLCQTILASNEFITVR